MTSKNAVFSMLDKWRNNKTKWCIVILCIYLFLFETYIIEMHAISHRRAALLYNYITGIMFLYSFIDVYTGYISHTHRQFGLISILSIMCNYILIIFTHHGFIERSAEMFFMFNGLIFAVTLLIYTNGQRHGYFKDKYEDE